MISIDFLFEKLLTNTCQHYNNGHGDWTRSERKPEISIKWLFSRSIGQAWTEKLFTSSNAVSDDPIVGGETIRKIVVPIPGVTSSLSFCIKNKKNEEKCKLRHWAVLVSVVKVTGLKIHTFNDRCITVLLTSLYWNKRRQLKNKFLHPARYCLFLTVHSKSIYFT